MIMSNFTDISNNTTTSNYISSIETLKKTSTPDIVAQNIDINTTFPSEPNSVINIWELNEQAHKAEESEELKNNNENKKLAN